ncbi:restriction endonuclease subunit S [Streptomyces sp. NPDC012616]|uniref:restriction endonuclease subunit S n=1 Tax=Streptomyces sp. NPDC012616 TaxID=3364840 RepID=UPI0036EEBA6E
MVSAAWQTVALSDFVRLKRGFDLPTHGRTHGSYPVVGSAGISGWHSQGPIKGPGVVVGRSGSSMGHVTYVDRDFWPLNTAMFVEDFFSNDPRYVAHVLSQLDFSSFNSGSAQPSLNRNFIARVPVTVPPVHEQRAIAEVLGALDGKVTLNEQICENSFALADCYSNSVHGDGGAVSRATVGQLVTGGQLEFGDGYRTKRDEHGQPGLPILRVAEVADGEIRPSFADYVRDEFRAVMGRKTSQAGDVVLTTKGTVGRVALMAADAPEFVYSPQVCYFRIKPDAQLSNIYLFHWMRGPEFWRQAAGMKGQTDMADYLSLGDIKSLRITLPSRAALAEFDRKCAPLHARSAAARAENRTLADLRDTLLPQLLSGKLRVRDAVRAVEEVV